MAGYTMTPVKGTGGSAETNPIPPAKGSPVIRLKGKWKTSNGLRDSESYWKPGQVIDMDESTSSKHTLCIGGTGAGKTDLLFWMAQQVLDQMTDDDVMVVFDSKGDFYECFGKHLPVDRVSVLGNSREYKAKSVRWNIFREILADGEDNETCRMNAMEIARTLFAQRMKQTTNAFFPGAAQDVLASLLSSICWDAKVDPDVTARMNNRDLAEYLSSSDAEELQLQLSAYNSLKATCSYIAGDNEQAQGVISELHSVIREVLLGVFAQEGSFSIREFVRGRGKKVLFLEYDLSIGSVLTPVYRLLIDLAIKETLAQASPRGRVYLFLDEYRLTPNLEHADDLVNFGRSKGARCFAGLQSIEQLYDMYGQSRGKAIAAGFGNVFCFRANDEATMKYVAGLYGDNLLGIDIVTAKGMSQHMVQPSKVIPDWCMSGQEPGQSVVCLAGKAPFLFHFDKFDESRRPGRSG